MPYVYSAGYWADLERGRPEWWMRFVDFLRFPYVPWWSAHTSGWYPAGWRSRRARGLRHYADYGDADYFGDPLQLVGSSVILGILYRF